MSHRPPASQPVEAHFATSGSEGAPVVWVRTARQMRAEVDLIVDTVIGEFDQVVSFAPPRHLFGALFGEVLPARMDVPVLQSWQHQADLPGFDPRKRTLFVCLPSSWLMLRKLVDQIADLPSAVALHGSGPTTDVTTGTVAALRGTGFRAIEIYGSTETGGVATRAIPGPSPERPLWRLLDDVQSLTGDGEQLLTVHSPRIGRRQDMAEPPSRWQLSDVVRVVDERSFELIGRRSRLIKVNGLRCDLAQVEAVVAAGFSGLDVVCVPIRDSIHGEHYDLFCVGEGGAVDAREVRGVLSADGARIPAPRAVYSVRSIPRTLTGKVKIDRLYAVAGLSASTTWGALR